MGNLAPDLHATRPMHSPRTASLASALLVLLVVACNAGAGASATPGPQPSTCDVVATATPTSAPQGGCSGAPMTGGELRLRLIDQLGPRWYCDPDEYPIAHGTEQQRAIERWPDVIAQKDLTAAIAARLGINVDAAVTDAQKQAIYHVWKVAVSIPFDDIGNGRYRFDYLSQPVNGAAQGQRTAGTIDDHGAITVEQQAPAGEPPCPICLSIGTRIDTPDGPIAVEKLRLGDPVWTLDDAGNRIAGTVIALGSTPAPANHHVVRLRLEDGRTVTASPGHPLADGRLLGDIRAGDIVDGSRVVAADLIPYKGADTYDLVASGDTGTYFAGGVPLWSTLR